jgi:hypothetical protein
VVLMTNDIENWQDTQQTIIDPARIAMEKPRADLTIHEAIIYRAIDFFPPDSDKRSYRLSINVDAKFRRVLRVITKSHPRTFASNNLYIAVQLGIQTLARDFSTDISDITKRYNEIVAGDNDFLFNRADGKHALSQDGQLKLKQIGFTLGQQDSLQMLAEELGITLSSLLVVAFWMAALTAPALDENFKRYGNYMLESFKQHLKSRRYELSYIN